MSHQLTYDVLAEDEAELRDLLDEQDTAAGLVTVRSTGHQVTEVCEVTVTGSLSAIVAWMESQDGGLDMVLTELRQAITDGRLVALS